MMDWEYIQTKYRHLKQEWDEAWEDWTNNPTEEKYYDLSFAKSRYSIFCMDIMEKLMEIPDLLERLKKM